MIDTCAESDFIANELVETIKDKIQITGGQGVSVTNPDGSALNSDGGVNIMLDGKKLHLNIANLKNADIILGMPSIKALGYNLRMNEMLRRSEEEQSIKSRDSARAVIAQLNLIQITEQAQGEGSGLSDAKWRAIAAVHNAVEGHAGIAGTLARLKAKNRDCKITAADVQIFVEFCDDCQRRVLPHNITNYKGTEHKPTAALEPWKVVYVDFMGPLVDGDESVKFNHVVGFTDAANAGLVLVSVMDTSAQEAARAMLEFMAQKEAPDNFIMRVDNGPAFHSNLIGTLTTMIGAERNFGIAYSHQDQTLIERMFKEVNKHAAILVRATKKLKKNP